MTAAAVLDFQFIWIWPFRCVDSVVFVFCTKFVWNNCYGHWDRRILCFLERKDAFWALIDLDLTHSATCGFGKENEKIEKKTVANWLFAQTTHVAVSKSKFACRVRPPVCSSIFQVLLKSVPWLCRCGWLKIAFPHYFGHYLIQQLVLPYKPWSPLSISIVGPSGLITSCLRHSNPPYICLATTCSLLKYLALQAKKNSCNQLHSIQIIFASRLVLIHH